MGHRRLGTAFPCCGDQAFFTVLYEHAEREQAEKTCPRCGACYVLTRTLDTSGGVESERLEWEAVATAPGDLMEGRTW